MMHSEINISAVIYVSTFATAQFVHFICINNWYPGHLLYFKRSTKIIKHCLKRIPEIF